jgi:cytochrome c553
MRDVILGSICLLAIGGNAWAAGDPAKGAELFNMCMTCHGEQGQGIEAQGAPRIAGQNASYLVRQLQNFRTGLRGAQVGDDYGALMSNFARMLPDDQAVEDVAAYIALLDK